MSAASPIERRAERDDRPPPRARARRAGVVARFRAGLAAVGRVLHAILGVPDHARYVAHMRARHPDCPVLDARAFERERLAARYERPGSRCC
jgi:uncharacterized short protein YbdD (DUF466 family)